MGESLDKFWVILKEQDPVIFIPVFIFIVLTIRNFAMTRRVFYGEEGYILHCERCHTVVGVDDDSCPHCRRLFKSGVFYPGQ
jgi:hypothetical protein